jgi:hypothetical protein
MKRWIGARAAVLCLAGVCVAALPAPSALASKASIKAVLKSFSGKVDVAEGHVLTAIGTYKSTHDPAPVDAAIGNSVKVLKEMRSKIAAQSASQPAVKTARTKLLKGIAAVIVAYEHLGTAYQEHGSSPPTAEAEAKLALSKLKAGAKQLKEAAKLLTG